MRVIQLKITPPPVSATVVRRPRIESLLSRLIEQHRVVCVLASAGAGKTTAVLQAAGQLRRPLAWLGVDATDAVTGRLLTYLEAAIARQVPEVEGMASAALGAQLPHAEGHPDPHEEPALELVTRGRTAPPGRTMGTIGGALLMEGDNDQQLRLHQPRHPHDRAGRPETSSSAASTLQDLTMTGIPG